MSAIVVFSVVVGVTRGFTTLTHAADALADQGAYVAFGMGVVALALYAAVGALGNDFDISKLYYPAIILTAVGILVVPLVVGGGEFGGPFIGVAYAGFINGYDHVYSSSIPAFALFCASSSASHSSSMSSMACCWSF